MPGDNAEELENHHLVVDVISECCELVEETLQTQGEVVDLFTGLEPDLLVLEALGLGLRLLYALHADARSLDGVPFLLGLLLGAKG